jgi:hypothetical protein
VSKTQDGSILDDEAVASAVAAVIDALDNVGAAAVGPVVTITNTEDGNVTNASEAMAGNPVVTVTQAGSTRTGAQIATLVAAAIDALDNVGAAADGAVVTVTNTLTGHVTEAYDESESMTLLVTQDGHILDAEDVADALATAIDAVSNLSAAAVAAVCTVTNDKYGNVTDASQNGACCTTLTKTQNGSIKTAAQVATATAAIINAVTGCGAAAVDTVVTVTNDEYGNVTNTADSASCTTNITVSAAGAIKTSTDVATALAAAIDAIDNVGAAADGANVTITNDLCGNTTDVSQSGACMTTITKTQDGSYLTAAEVAALLETSIEATTGLDSTIADSTITVTCTYDGTTTNASQEGACCTTLTTTNEGTDIATYLTIDAGDNESNGTSIIVPDGWKLVLFPPRMQMTAVSASGLLDGTQIQYVFTGFDDENNTAPDQNTRTYTCTMFMGRNDFDERDYVMPLEGSDGAIVTIKELKLTNARATDVEIFALLYKERI